MPLSAVMLASSTKEKNETERDEEGEPQRKGNTNIPYTKEKGTKQERTHQNKLENNAESFKSSVFSGQLELLRGKMPLIQTLNRKLALFSKALV
jgi:hypothetical protein